MAMMLQLIGKTRFAITCLMVIFTVTPAYADLVASVDRTIISDADLVTLTIRASDDSADVDLNFSGVERDFDILDTGVSSNSSISIINGRTTSVAYKDYRLVLKPKRQGNLTIPRIIAGNNVSEPISIRVQPLSDSQKQRMRQFVFFETEVDTNETFVQGQILYSVRLFYSDAIGGDFPQAPSLPDVIIENIENEKRFESIVDGRRYYVLEKQYAIFPQKSGELTIPRERFIGTRGRGGMFSQRQRVTAVSESHTVRIKPVPQAFSGDYWIPAESLNVTESWTENPPNFRVGEPVNRTLTIRAAGVPHTLLPVFEDITIDGAKVYADPPESQNRPTSEGITALQQTTLGIVPTRTGSITLPEVRIPWWNTRSNREEIAVIPAATFDVEPASGTQSEAPVTPVAAEQAITQSSPLTAQPTIWRWVSLVLALLWIMTLWQWLITRRKLNVQNSSERTHQDVLVISADEQSIFEQFRTACRASDSQQAHRLLYLWGKARYPEITSINELTHRLPELKGPVDSLEAFLFSGSAAARGQGAHWEGRQLLKMVTDARRGHSGASEKRSTLVAGLNPA